MFQRIVTFCALMVLSVYRLDAQDALFSQHFAVPIELNPALTGKYDGTYRIATAYRSQWFNTLDQSFETFKATADMRFKILKSDYDYVGFGVNFLTDRSGLAPVSQYKFLFNAAIHKALGFRKTSMLSLGFYAGPTQRNIDYGRLFFADQFNGELGDFSNATAEILPFNNISFADLGVGLDYRYAGKEWQGGLGIAVQHINQPNISQYQTPGDDDVIIPFASAIRPYLWARLPLSDNRLYVTPRVISYFQENLRLLQFGSTLSLPITYRSNNSLIAGLFAKIGNNASQSMELYEASILFGVSISSINVGVSYDLNIRSQKVFNEQQGTIEISITYTGSTDHRTEPEVYPVF